MIKESLSYLKWEPIIKPEKVFSDIVGINEVRVESNHAYWLEMRPAEKGRYVIVQASDDGTQKDVIPQGFNARTRVHEYGGGSYAVFEISVYFVNFSDQRLYSIKVGESSPTPLTPEKNSDGSLGKYASLIVSSDGNKLLFVYEKEFEDKENENFIAGLDLRNKDLQEPVILAQGKDFYADVCMASDGKKIAWLAWDHPDMPWDSTELMIAEIEGLVIENTVKVAGGGKQSICYPRFDQNNNLYFIMDKEKAEQDSPYNWWNFYRYRDDKVEQITFEQAEFGEPHWVFGQSGYAILPNGQIVAKMTKDGKDTLVTVMPEEKYLTHLHEEFTYYSNIQTCGRNCIFFVGASLKKGAALYRLNPESLDLYELKRSSSLSINDDDISESEFISYSTKDGDKSYAYFYPPKNNQYELPADELPPLLVIAHGGPTASTKGYFSFIIQFWTSAGFAVVDVDYRGSTGFGRKYRDKLLGTWGVVDACDVADAVRYLVKEGRVEATKVAVRGGSAGGYMVQRVMTEYPDLFSVGASYYGIGNLITLVVETHKFESCYIDNLVGAKMPEGEALYKDRSPINHLDKLKSPMIIFQGSDDKIVTPECSREMARILKDRGICYEYVEYEGEAHGFRKKENNVDSLNRELKFYRDVFNKSGDRE